MKGSLGGVDESLVETFEGGCNYSLGATDCQLRWSTGDLDLVVRVDYAGTLLSQQVTPAYLWMLLPDMSSQANCATTPKSSLSSFAYESYGPYRFIARNLRKFSGGSPCGYSDAGGYVCPVFNKVCKSASVKGTVEGCIWSQ